MLEAENPAGWETEGDTSQGILRRGYVAGDAFRWKEAAEKKLKEVREDAAAAAKARDQRSLNEAKEDLDDAEQLVSQQALYTDFLQSKLNEMESLALRAGADPSTVSEIMARKYKA